MGVFSCFGAFSVVSKWLYLVVLFDLGTHFKVSYGAHGPQ